MYSLKVQSTTAKPEFVRNEVAIKGNEGMDADVKELNRLVDQLDFSAGNPRVEHVTGVVHLYRDIDSTWNEREGVHEQENGGELPEHRSCQICVLSTPPDMGFAEFCTFLGSYVEKVKEIRLVRRNGGKRSHLVLLDFEAQTSADGFFMEYNDKPFCLLEPDLVCRLLFVRSVEFYEGKTDTSPHQGILNELPSCPVCLERLDPHVSGIVTTVCNHRFHNQCLRQWVDSSCPVCRYCQHPSEITSSCSKCSTSVDLWMCLICGHVGCGRYKGSHAANHFESSGHGYALELESQRIWDYARDAYVHRIICNKVHEHGKEEECMPSHAAQEGYYEESVPQEMHDDALVKSKIDAIATEYSHIMVSQLESQRVYFEGVVESHHRETLAALEASQAKAACATQAAVCADDAAQKAENKVRQIQAKKQDLQARLSRAEEEKEFLRQLNETLISNQKAFKEKLNQSLSSEEELKAKVEDLEEQVRDLMMFIEARDTIEKCGAQEAQGGSLMALPEKPTSKKHRQRRR